MGNDQSSQNGQDTQNNGQNDGQDQSQDQQNSAKVFYIFVHITHII